MLSDRVYDLFVLMPVIFRMYYKHNVSIEGNASPGLYHNVNHYLNEYL